MGEQLYNSSDKAREIFEIGSEVTGTDLAEACFGSETESLSSLRVAQPALGAVAIAEFTRLKELGIMFDVGIGHSMGEVPLLAMSGMLSVKDTFYLLEERAEATEEASKERPGKMAVIRNLPAKNVKKAAAKLLAQGRLFLANANAPDQVVFTGDIEPLEQL